MLTQYNTPVIYWHELERFQDSLRHHVKKTQTDKEISITDKRFLFVDREMYEAEVGVVLEELFSQQESEGTADAVLLETLTV